MGYNVNLYQLKEEFWFRCGLKRKFGPAFILLIILFNCYLINVDFLVSLLHCNTEHLFRPRKVLFANAIEQLQFFLCK